jgi:hypothetical protein
MKTQSAKPEKVQPVKSRKANGRFEKIVHIVKLLATVYQTF